MTCLVPEHLKFGSSSRKFLQCNCEPEMILELNLVNRHVLQFVYFECKNILLAKDMSCFATFIQTTFSKLLTSSAKVHLIQPVKLQMFDDQTGHG